MNESRQGAASEMPRRRLPRWARLTLGVAMLLLGAVLVTSPLASIQIMAALVAAGLALVGATRFLSASASRYPWLDRVVGALLVSLSAGAYLWQGSNVQMLAIFVAIAIFASGMTMLIGTFRGTVDERLAAGLHGLAALIFSLLALTWPRLALFVVGVLFGVWLIYSGLTLVVSVVTERPLGVEASAPRKKGRWRRYLAVLGGLGSLLLAAAVLVVSHYLHAGDPRVVPDAFYTPPLGVPSEAGAIIRSEPFTVRVPDGAQAWRILYTTTQPDGSPAVASAIVVAPVARPAGPLPVLAVAHGTSGIVPGCAPLLMEDPFGNGPTAGLEFMVRRGWVGVATDYVGLGTQGPHAYLVGEAAARNVLDALRAAHTMPELLLDRRTVVWGHSQGGHGALWTGIVAPEYAPEFELLGVAAMAPASDLHALALGIKDSAAGKIVSAYIAASWNEIYPDVGVSGLVTPGYWPLVERIGQLCFGGRDVLASISISTQLLDRIFPDAVFDGPIDALLRANTPSRAIDVPLLVAQGGADSVILPPVQRGWVEGRCAAGQALDYREFAGLDHMPLVAAQSPFTPELVAWTEARLRGEPPTPTC